MKYRLIRYQDGGWEYESFPNDKVPKEYQDIVIDELPRDIIEAEKKKIMERRNENK